jgi:hypothetical protein
MLLSSSVAVIALARERGSPACHGSRSKTCHFLGLLAGVHRRMS